MVDRVGQIETGKSPDAPQKPPIDDLIFLTKNVQNIDSLQHVLKAVRGQEKAHADKQKVAKEEIKGKSVEQEEADKSQEEDGVSLHRKEKKSKKKTARQKKMERAASLKAVEEVKSDPSITDQDGEEALPDGFEKAYEQELSEMDQFLSIIAQDGDPRYASLVKLYRSEISTMSHPPTLADASKLNMMMQSLQQAASSLPAAEKQTFFQMQVTLFNSMEKSMQGSIDTLTPKIAALKSSLAILNKLAPLIENGSQAAEKLASGKGSTDDFIAMGENIIALEKLLKDLPPNSPYRDQIKKALASWSSLTSSNPQFPPGEILGYSIFLAAMQDYALGGDASEKDIGQVWQELSSLDDEGLPGLQSAFRFIHSHFPSSSMTPTDWSVDQQGIIQMNYKGFSQLLKGGLEKALSNMGTIRNTLSTMQGALQDEINATQSTLSAENEQINEVSSQIALIDKMLHFATGEITPDPDSSTALQKALLPMIRAEIQGYLSLIAILESYLPGTDFSSLKSQLATISGHLPNLTDSDLNALNGILGKLNGYAQNIPSKSFQSTYWGAELDLVDSLIKMGNSATANDTDVTKALQDIESIVKKMQGGGCTSGDLTQLTNDLMTLMAHGDQLPLGNNNMLNSFLQSLGRVTGSSFGNATSDEADLLHVITLSMQQQLLKEYLQEHPKDSSLSGFQNFVDQYVSSLPQSGNPELSAMEKGLSDLSDCIGPKAIESLATIQNGHLVANSDALDSMYSSFLSGGLHPVGGDEGGWLVLLNTLTPLINSFDANKNGLAGMQKILDQLSKEHDLCWSMLWKDDSLADLFRRIMLDQFMPAQEAKLEEYSSGLQFTSDAAGMLQNLMKQLNALNQAQSDFPKKPTNAKEKEAMQKAIAQDGDSINKALSQIDADIDKLNHEDYGNNPAALAGKKQLIQQLTALKGNLQAAQAQLGKVANDLSQPGYPNIEQDMDTLINGDPSAKPPNFAGGLSTIMGTLSGDSHHYASISLTQEFQLQMVMSRVQQEWEITSTCMKSIHDAYMTLAKALHR